MLKTDCLVSVLCGTRQKINQKEAKSSAVDLAVVPGDIIYIYMQVAVV